jgi:hypothetical protein
MITYNISDDEIAASCCQLFDVDSAAKPPCFGKIAFVNHWKCDLTFWQNGVLQQDLMSRPGLKLLPPLSKTVGIVYAVVYHGYVANNQYITKLTAIIQNPCVGNPYAFHRQNRECIGK